jgi:7-cyano-7-deazaguanine synthase
MSSPKPESDGALVLFSGGQDSTACLAWALERFARVETVGFAYGQRHAVELEVRPRILSEFRRCFPRWTARLGEDHVLDLTLLGQISDTALTKDVEITMQANGLPNTFVPGRNLIFLTFAATLAYRRGVRHLVTGVCETDYSGYPDCRDDTMKALQVALNLGMETKAVIHTPLMWLDKGDTWRLADELGSEDLIRITCEETHSCYLGDRAHKHDWGYGCGTCPACQLRAEGYRSFREKRRSR